MTGGPHDKAAQGYHSGRPTVGAAIAIALMRTLL
ncbi:hypothetical protein SAMN05216376_11459 [Mameliella alba]|nr:hypothetical protein SAMN05216376_11459 [Mameliella alba]